MRNETPDKTIDEEESIDEILEELAPESIDTEEEAGKEETEVAEEVEEYELPKEEDGYILKHEKEYEVPEDVLDEHPLISPSPKGPRLYMGIFGVLGLIFGILTVLAVIGTILVLRWDTWIKGAAEENIGDYQMSYVYLGTVGIVVGAVGSLFNVYRNRKNR